MKKNDQEINFNKSDLSTNKEFEIHKIKTTNVNVLLNRVRLDKKKTLKKRVIFTVVLVSLVSSLAVYFIV